MLSVEAMWAALRPVVVKGEETDPGVGSDRFSTDVCLILDQRSRRGRRPPRSPGHGLAIARSAPIVGRRPADLAISLLSEMRGRPLAGCSPDHRLDSTASVNHRGAADITFGTLGSAGAT
jgi:hypothetical protein